MLTACFGKQKSNSRKHTNTILLRTVEQNGRYIFLLFNVENVTVDKTPRPLTEKEELNMIDLLTKHAG
jgi:hypothetical protein